MSAKVTVGVLGAGNWGTTLAHLIASNGHSVRLWMRDGARAAQINETRMNPSVSDLRLAAGVQAVSDIGEAIAQASLVFMALPSQAFRQVSRALGECLRPDQLVVHGSKGLELGTHRRMSEILVEETCARQIGVLSGPNIAAEIARGDPAGTVVASRFPAIVATVRTVLSSERLKVFSSTDVVGVELCGALKNVVAVAAGMADEMSLGDNAKAFLITRGMLELMRLALAMGAEPVTAAGLAGIGDLIATCQSPLSRNHRVGVALARGQRLDEAVAQLGMVAEGVHASRAARALAAARALDMPLFESVDRVLHEGWSAQAALAELMHMPAGRDAPLSWTGSRLWL